MLALVQQKCSQIDVNRSDQSLNMLSDELNFI